ncbi:MAG: hypothetical protein AAF628_12475 [Planctomycetota bacterium]
MWFGGLDSDRDMDAVVALGGDEFATLAGTSRHLAWRSLPRVGRPLTLDVLRPAEHALRAVGRRGRGPVRDTLRRLSMDPFRVVGASAGVLDGNGRAAAMFAVPAAPVLLGAAADWQAAVGTPLVLTNLEATVLTGL